jgi:hypothetical protein
MAEGSSAKIVPSTRWATGRMDTTAGVIGGAVMVRTKLQPKVIAALLSAGATEEMISGAHQILGIAPSRPGGRPRKYKNRAECDRAYRERRKQREKTRDDLLTRLHEAAHWKIDPEADVEPIRALIAQGCDLEADILPTVARDVPCEANLALVIRPRWRLRQGDARECPTDAAPSAHAVFARPLWRGGEFAIARSP